MTPNDITLLQHNLNISAVTSGPLNLRRLDNGTLDNSPAFNGRLDLIKCRHIRLGNRKYLGAIILRLHNRSRTRSTIRSRTKTSVYRSNITLQGHNHLSRNQPARYYFEKSFTRLTELAHVIITKTPIVKLRNILLPFLQRALRLHSALTPLRSRSRHPTRSIPRLTPSPNLILTYRHTKLLDSTRQRLTLLVGKRYVVANLLQTRLCLLQIILLDQFVSSAQRLLDAKTLQRPSLGLLNKLEQLFLSGRRKMLLIALRHQELPLSFGVESILQLQLAVPNMRLNKLTQGIVHTAITRSYPKNSKHHKQ